MDLEQQLSAFSNPLQIYFANNEAYAQKAMPLMKKDLVAVVTTPPKTLFPTVQVIVVGDDFNLIDLCRYFKSEKKLLDLRVVIVDSQKYKLMDVKPLGKDLHVDKFLTGGKALARLMHHCHAYMEDLQSVGSIQSYGLELKKLLLADDKESLHNVIERVTSFSDNLQKQTILLQLYHTYKQTDKEIDCLKTIIRLDDAALWAVQRLAKLYLLTGKVAYAMELLERLNKLSSFNEERVFILGYLYLQLNAFDKARKAFSGGLSIGGHPAFSQGLVRVDILENNQNRLTGLLKDNEDKKPYVQFLTERAMSAAASKDLKNANGWLRTAVLLARSTDLQVYACSIFNVVLLLLKIKKVPLAIEFLKAQLEKTPHLPQIKLILSLQEVLLPPTGHPVADSVDKLTQLPFQRFWIK